ncbi:hypothetical protein C8Q75DRAFT_836178 [Abortiporus biennis]|nr:hypothetical protein C8Q75DRAFT_836178 [Abortiporus biennis]
MQSSTALRNDLPAHSQGRPLVERNSASRRRTEHVYTLTTGTDKPWAILTVFSRARESSQLPSIFEDDELSGTFKLELEREDTIKSVNAIVVGQLTTSATDAYTFLQIHKELWSVSRGEPPILPSNNAATSTFNGKLRGIFRWPFSFTLPANVSIKTPQGRAESFRVPPSFSERMSRVHIQYQLIVQIRRGKFRIDSQVSTVFGFTPLTYPGPFSLARQLAYLERRPLSGPDTDRAGWLTLAAVQVKGRVFSAREVTATCQLSLALPLCYTRGSVLPCSLRIQCTDTQALDLLSMPRSIDVRLKRHISTNLVDVSNSSNKISTYGMSFEPIVTDVRSAVWWAASLGSDFRVLSGEVHLPRDLKPTCHIGKFILHVSQVFLFYYSLAFYTFSTLAFSPKADDPLLLQTQQVEIVTAFAPGPKPLVYCKNPPSYDDASSIGQLSEFSFW